MKFPEKYRMNNSLFASMFASSPNQSGLFVVPSTNQCRLQVIATNGMGWDHVSVSVIEQPRCPTWEEMCLVKDLFFEKNETVIQYHPKEADYINNHPYCLHLWKKQGYEVPTPPTELIGVKLK